MDEKRTFAVVLEPEEEGGFTVRVPAFAEVVTYGKDEREAMAMAEDATWLVIADCTAGGLDSSPPDIPVSRPLKDFYTAEPCKRTK